MSISFPFDFSRVPRFFDNWNIKYKVVDMSNDNNFQFVFATHCAENIDICLNGDYIDTSVVTVGGTVDASLKWENEIISVRNDVEWFVGQQRLPLKAVFLVDKSTQCVMGYSINNNSFNVTNRVIIDAGTILWSISNGQ